MTECVICGSDEADRLGLTDDGGGATVALCDRCVGQLEQTRCAACGELEEAWSNGRDATVHRFDETGIVGDVCPDCRDNLLKAKELDVPMGAL